MLQKEREKSYVILSTISALRGIRDNLRFVIWQPFALSLGLKMSSISSLESMMDFFKLIFEPAFGSLSDQVGRKNLTLFREFLILTAGIQFVIAQNEQIIYIAIILIGSSNALVTVLQALVAESSDASSLAQIFGLTGAFYTGAGLIGTLSAGYIADSFGYRTVYMISVFFSIRFRFAPDSPLSTATGNRLGLVARMIADEMRTEPPNRRDSILQRYSASYQVEFVLYANTGQKLAGRIESLPEEVLRHLSESTPSPRMLRGNPRPPAMGFPPPDREPSHRPPTEVNPFAFDEKGPPPRLDPIQYSR